MRFTKLQATGNDFILVEAGGGKWDWSRLAQRLCHRHFGVGGDGLLVLSPGGDNRVRMRMFNPDGSESEACGNGLRCVGKYAWERGWVSGRRLLVDTLAGERLLQLHIRKGKVCRVAVEMSIPRFRAEEIPLSEPLPQVPILDYPLDVAGRRLALAFVNMGNPHAVAFLEGVASFPLAEVGPQVEHHPLFPQRINFEIARLVSQERIEARVWERGAGETLSCGSGACAIAVAARLHGWTGERVEIALPGGVLRVAWDSEGEVELSGPAETVFEGNWLEEE